LCRTAASSPFCRVKSVRILHTPHPQRHTFLDFAPRLPHLLHRCIRLFAIRVFVHPIPRVAYSWMVIRVFVDVHSCPPSLDGPIRGRSFPHPIFSWAYSWMAHSCPPSLDGHIRGWFPSHPRPFPLPSPPKRSLFGHPPFPGTSNPSKPQTFLVPMFHVVTPAPPLCGLCLLWQSPPIPTRRQLHSMFFRSDN